MFKRHTPCQNPSKCGVLAHPKGSKESKECLSREAIKVAQLPTPGSK